MPPKRYFQLHIALQRTNPRVWRRLIVADDVSLWRLHEILQVVMGWMNSHLMHFKAGGAVFGRPDWEDAGSNDSADARKVKLKTVFAEPGDKMLYVYDFGDWWAHEIELEGIIDGTITSQPYPRCVAGENAAPPEDCGGSPGFENLKRILADPDDEEHEAILQWLDFYYPNYDPTEFSLSSINKILNLGAERYHRIIAKLYERR